MNRTLFFCLFIGSLIIISYFMNNNHKLPKSNKIKPRTKNFKRQFDTLQITPAFNELVTIMKKDYNTISNKINTITQDLKKEYKKLQ